jgi:HlyD family type I secretion membrane fusion protein
MMEANNSPDMQEREPARGPIQLGFFVLVPCLALLLLWAFFAPLSVAAIANGELVVELRRRNVQHLEGGIVEKILIREGEAVDDGTPLIVMADLNQRGQAHALLEKISSSTALRARLRAEWDGLTQPDFSELDGLIGLEEDKRQALVQLHGGIFLARQEGLTSKLELIRSQQKQADIEKTASMASRDILIKKLSLVREEHAGIKRLYEKSFTTLTKKLEIERLILDLEAQIEAATSAEAKFTQAEKSADIEYANMLAESRRSTLEELQSTEVALQEWTSQLVTLRDDLRRRMIRSPVKGRVLDLQVHTEGAVIAPGGHILDVVPDNERVIVDARVSPNDIDIVERGTSAKIILSAYKAKKVPKLDGVVISVSGDALTDPAQGERYYLARIEVNKKTLRQLKAKVELYPGMPAQVFLLGTDRTFADYILQPVFDATYRAFREE